MVMKILVGILYSIENEFEECKRAIEEQQQTDFEYFTIEKLPNLEAHNKLYQTFMSRAAEFDLFVKVDADMVLCRNTFFKEVADEMNQHQKTNHLEIGVWDYFTQQLIGALNIFRNNVVWSLSPSDIFVDIQSNTRGSKTYMNMDGHLAPAAYHCPNPSRFQSFHYGLHKAAKLIQTNSKDKWRRKSRVHSYYIYRTWENYKKNKTNLNLCLAVAGIFWGIDNTIGASEINFTSEKVRASFEKFARKEHLSLISFIDQEGRKKQLFLPRWIWIYYAVNRFMLNSPVIISLLWGFFQSFWFKFFNKTEN